MSEPGSGRLPTPAAVGLVLLPVLCCALPMLIAAGGLGVLGAVLRNPWVVGAAVLLGIGLVGRWSARRRGDDCCDRS
jgi:hypothetical protein